MARVIKWWLFLGIGFYFCGVLTVIPIPMEYQWFRPYWLLMLVIYCQLANPKSFNPGWAWVMGLLVDSLLGTRLGEHALVFAVVGYFTSLLRPRFLLRPLWQQVGKVLLLVCLGQIILLWFHVLAGQNPHTLLYWTGALTSCLIWPIFALLLQSICQSLSVLPFTSRSI